MYAIYVQYINDCFYYILYQSFIKQLPSESEIFNKKYVIALPYSVQKYYT